MLEYLEPCAVVELGNAWGANTVNCTPFRQYGLFSRGEYQYGCFYNIDLHLTVFRRNLTTLKVDYCIMDNFFSLNDSHHSPCVVLDKSNRLHVMCGAHVSPPYYFRSNPNQIDLTENKINNPLWAENVTYPSFLVGKNSDIYLLYRRGYPSKSDWRFIAWDDANEAWDGMPFSLISGDITNSWPSGPYLNTPIQQDKNKFGFFSVWRSESINDSFNEVCNIGIDYFEADLSQKKTYTLSNKELPTPVTPSISERILAIPWGSNLSNQSGSTRLLNGKPFGTAFWGINSKTPQIHIFWATQQSIWKTRTLTQFETNFNLSGRGTIFTPHSRPVCVTLGNGNVVVIYRSIEYGNNVVAHILRPPYFKSCLNNTFVLTKKNLGYYEPVVDQNLAINKGVLSLYLQTCSSGMDGTQIAPEATAAQIIDWDLSSIII